MRRVHSQIGFLLVLAVSAACTSLETEEFRSERMVGFRASVNERQDTRAVVDAVTLPAGSHFGVYAYQDNGTSYMSNTKVGHTGSYSPAANWPVSSDLTFHAYYPHNGGSTANIAPAFTKTGGTIGFTAPSGADIDLMYAKGSGSRLTDNGKVSMEFNHLLSWLNIQAKVTGEAGTIVIQSATLTAMTEGIYTIESSSWTTRTARASRKQDNLNKTINSTGWTNVTDFLIVPQGLPGNASNSLVINYTLNGAAKVLTVQNTDLPPVKVASIGQKFVLNITFNLTNSLVDVSYTTSVVDWNSGLNKNVDAGPYTLSVNRNEYKFYGKSESAPTDDASLLQINTTYASGWKATFYSNATCTTTTSDFWLVDGSGNTISGFSTLTHVYIARSANYNSNRFGYLKIVAGELSVVVKVTQDVLINSGNIIYFSTDRTSNKVLQIGKWGVDVTDIQDIAFFKFGSVLGFSIGSTSFASGYIKFNPTNENITTFPDIPYYSAADYSAGYTNTSDPAYHHGSNIKVGKGDPCKLIGLSQDVVKSMPEELLDAYDSGWRLPTDEDNAYYIGITRAITDAVGNGYTSATYPYWTANGTSETNPGVGQFPIGGNINSASGRYLNTSADRIPAAGRRTSASVTSSKGSYGYYWTSTVYGSGNGGYMYFISSHVYPRNAATNNQWSHAVRCVR